MIITVYFDKFRKFYLALCLSIFTSLLIELYFFVYFFEVILSYVKKIYV